jgi:hypothetical protein
VEAAEEGVISDIARMTGECVSDISQDGDKKQKVRIVAADGCTQFIHQTYKTQRMLREIKWCQLFVLQGRIGVGGGGGGSCL